MPRRVVVAADARADLQALFAYIAEHDSLAAAERVLAGLREAAASLAEQPLRGRMPREMQLLGRTDFREIVVHKTYRIIYRVEEDAVVVYGVADGRRDMQGFLYRRLVR
jgi:toxin ParE1/3/4